MRKEDAALGWIVFGSVFLFSAFFNTIVNLNSVPGIIEGGLWVELLAFGVVGVVSLVYGAVTYRRTRGAVKQAG